MRKKTNDTNIAVDIRILKAMLLQGGCTKIAKILIFRSGAYSSCVGKT